MVSEHQARYNILTMTMTGKKKTKDFSVYQAFGHNKVYVL